MKSWWVLIGFVGLLVLSGCLKPDEFDECQTDAECPEGQGCSDGLCISLDACPGEQIRCGELCVDISSDIQHCGSCSPCSALANANLTTCSQGVCQYICAGGWTDSDNDLSLGIEGNGCECPPGEACGCEEACVAPPPTCEDNTAITYSGAGETQTDCSCDFSSVRIETPCAQNQHCERGACIVTECEEHQDCEAPTASCADTQTLQTWEMQCVNHRCTQIPVREQCGASQICNEGACESVACIEHEQCQHPAPSCEADVLTHYDENSTARCVNNVCDSSEAQRITYCREQNQRCRNGACISLCEEGLCTPPEPFCIQQTAVSFSEAGSCDPLTGLCDFSQVRVETLCTDSNMVCENGQCVETYTGMVRVPAGDFLMGSNDFSEDEAPQRTVTLSTYFMDIHEVTTAEYRRCVEARVCPTPGMEEEGYLCGGEYAQWNNWLQNDRENHPINCVTKEAAVSYCSWVGKRLPTEAEWEKAARGTDGRTYPWGEEEANCDRAVTALSQDRDDWSCGENHTWAVGSKPTDTSIYGVIDTAGNVAEWVSDWYDSDYYSSGNNVDPQGPVSGSNDVVRGGSLDSYEDRNRVTDRTSIGSDVHFVAIGFRCAKSH